MKSKTRTSSSGEVFTPTSLVTEMLDKLPIEEFTDPSKNFLDPSCGNGQFLVNVAKYKLKYTDINKAIASTYGVDLMVDNVCDTIARLYILAHNWEDPFTHNTINTNLLTITDPGHELDYPTFDTLTPDFSRSYLYQDHPIHIKFGCYSKSKRGAYFECNGVLWHTIVCADSLKFLTEDNDFYEAEYNFDTMTPEELQHQIDDAVDKATNVLLDEIERLEGIIEQQRNEIAILNKLTDIPF